MDPFSKFNRQAQLVPDVEWARLQEDPDYRFVRRTRLSDFAWVITIWQGLDPCRFLNATGPFLIFETSAFKLAAEGIRLDAGEQRWVVDGAQPRHATEKQALRCHGEMVAKLCLEAQRPVEVAVMKAVAVIKARS